MQQLWNAAEHAGGLHAGGLAVQKLLDTVPVLQKDTDEAMIKVGQISAAVPRCICID